MHPNINSTVENEVNRNFHFLHIDTEIINGILKTHTYQKLIATDHHYIMWNSFISLNYKISTI